MNNQLYRERFISAVDKSDEWRCSSENDFEPNPPRNTKVSHYLDVVHRFVDWWPANSAIRTQCALVHFRLWEALQAAGLPSIITIGDVAWDGDEPEFGTSYESLAKEWRGEHAGTSVKTDLHVWLTLPDGETIIDITVLPYFMRTLPADFDWKKRIHVADAMNCPHPIEHMPMLIGITFLFQSDAVEMPFTTV
ncbi:MAG: hypothetical protein H7Y60_12400 [Rhodospirillaceae bacterium]|nr:hypothetical protein [Rhodospirillales bacterium]